MNGPDARWVVADPGGLPDPFAWPDGRRVDSPRAWPERARAWIDEIVATAYGGLPAAPERISIEMLCDSRARRLPGAPRALSYRVRALGGVQEVILGVKLLVPDADGPVPAIAYGDGCWWNLGDAAIGCILERGLALALFDRTEMATDLPSVPGTPPPRRGGLYEAYPGGSFGAIAAWAWGYHRCVDLLVALPWIDPRRIAVTGFSRGGKAALVAGATDPRVGLVHDHASGAGGSAAYRFVARGGETIEIVDRFPAWFGPGLRAYVGRERELPFDQHCLLAAIAPRPRLSTYATHDLWANPEGMVLCARAAAEVYGYLGHSTATAFHLRPGEHAHTADDWSVLLDFIDVQWRGRAPRCAYGEHGYAPAASAFAWRVPAGAAADPADAAADPVG
jgi:dienelactone hydrolase